MSLDKLYPIAEECFDFGFTLLDDVLIPDRGMSLSSGSQTGLPSQYSNMDISVCSSEFTGFQPVSLRILRVLPKIILSSEGRINRRHGTDLLPSRRTNGSRCAKLPQSGRSGLRKDCKPRPVSLSWRQDRNREPYH